MRIPFKSPFATVLLLAAWVVLLGTIGLMCTLLVGATVTASSGTLAGGGWLGILMRVGVVAVLGGGLVIGLFWLRSRVRRCSDSAPRSS
jgi:hypothetical protein